MSAIVFALTSRLHGLLSFALFLILCSILGTLELVDFNTLYDLELQAAASLYSQVYLEQALAWIKMLHTSPLLLFCAGEFSSLYPYLCLIIIRLLLPPLALLPYLPGWLLVTLLLYSYLQKLAVYCHQSLFSQKYLIYLLTLLTRVLLPIYVLQPFVRLQTLGLGSCLVIIYLMLLPALVINRRGISPL
ncbi:MAG: hypothetical protein K6F05_06120 [Succinivibrio sp.]|nr:hypothetical protein [Succinivibrio sp.]